MCGLAGFIDANGFALRPSWPSLLTAMSGAIRHRGPDDEGQFLDDGAGVGFAFRRLSILDLSMLGHQPMEGADGRHVLMFNGEIYNFAELRTELEAKGYGFRGRSDTEVMLAAFAAWGVAAATARFNGMFAFALWDRVDRILYLGRDRLGEKPLYYGWCKGVLLFGSELEALRAHPAFDDTIDRGALSLLLRFGYINHPHSIYQCIRKVPPATILEIRGDRTTEHRYWSIREIAERGEASPYQGSFEDAVRELETLLTDSVRLRMIADVPLGAFLSGGIDSSLIVSLMQRIHSQPTETFAIGFAEQAFNEAGHARAVAQHLGTRHTELYVSAQDALRVVPRLASIYDEPCGDSSAIPTHLVAQLARKRVTVALSGDAGDELFGGYNRYAAGLLWSSRLRKLPRGIRNVAARSIETLSIGALQSSFDVASRVLPRRLRLGLAGEKILKLARVMRAEDAGDVYASLMQFWQGASELTIAGEARRSTEETARLASVVHQMMFTDMVSYLPGDILTKVDRATMAVSLEARVPFLDPRVIEFAWRLPVAWKTRRGEGKRILRSLLYRHVPAALVDRPKAGFVIPLDRWLRGALRPWAEELLDERRLRSEGYLHPEPVRRRWREHLDGRRAWQHDLWNVLMFQAWLERTRASSA